MMGLPHSPYGESGGEHAPYLPGSGGGGGGVGAWTEVESLNAFLTPEAPLLSGQTLRVRTEQGGARAFMRGVIKATSAISAEVVLFILPVAFRPPGQTSDLLYATGGVGPLFVHVETNGHVWVSASLTSGAAVPLDGFDWNLT